jgi:hypothetical protein
MAPINSQAKGESYKSGSYGNVHNYVFFNKVDESSHRLLPVNDYLITTTTSLPEGRQSQKETAAVQWFLYFLVKDDTDGDKGLTNKDQATLAVSDSGGIGCTEIIQNIEQVYGHTLRDASTLLVIYRSGGKNYTARVDLLNRKVLSTTELPALGDDVQ